MEKMVKMNQTLGQNDSRKSNNNVKATKTSRNGGEKSNKCNQCEYVSSHAGNLKRHLKTHSREKLNQCDFASSDSGTLGVHLKTHSEENPNQWDFTSFGTGTLGVHLKTHSGENPNQCNQCEFASSETSTLGMHMKKHSVKGFRLGDRSDPVSYRGHT